MIGLLSHMDGYIVKSNRETGDGRCDIYIKPLSIFDKAVIIEMKFVINQKNYLQSHRMLCSKLKIRNMNMSLMKAVMKIL